MSTFTLSSDHGGPLKKIDYAAALNQEQLAVVLEGDGACLVLAGAGSGKTRTLTYRVAYLIEHGVDPSSILLLTFTNKASREMVERVETVLGPAAKGIWGGTFHSIGARLLRVFAEELGYKSTFSILDHDDSRDLIKAVMKDLKIDPKARRFPAASVVGDIISFARNTQQNIDDALEIKHPNFVPFSGEIEEIARQYHVRKKQANVMDFDDLLTNFAMLLESESGRRIAERFRYVLVDEYQDTNAVQARIVAAVSRVYKNIIAVGDDAQSIYAFRGADVKNILSFPELHPSARVFKLLTNYRSTPEILELANESLSHNVDQFQKELIGLREHGEKPKLIACQSASQEARYVAEQILELRNQGTALANMAVLFRSSAHSQQLEFELLKRDIPYEYRGGQKFFERAHIKDVVSFLRVFENPKDEIAWLRCLGLQTGIGAATAAEVSRQAVILERIEQVTDENMIVPPSRGRSGWDDLLKILQALVAKGRIPAPLIRSISSSTYQDYLEREYPNYRERLEDLEQLALFAEGYEDLSAFLADISLYDDVLAARQDAGRGDNEKMILSTIHQAKGLEWDSVFIIHLADSAFPNKRAMAEEDGMEEERRLFYVAVTRARRNLFLSYPLTMGHETLMFNQPSTFIDEVNPRLFDRVELREAGFRTSPPLGGGVRGGESWSWDDADSSWEEPTIQIESTTVFKKTETRKKPKPGNFLGDY